jgi:hypothetical protein
MVSVCGLWLDVDCIETAGEGITALLGSNVAQLQIRQADSHFQQQYESTLDPSALWLYVHF